MNRKPNPSPIYSGRLDLLKTQNSEPEMVTIRILDEMSGCYVATVTITLDAFARGLFGRGMLPCNYQVFDGVPRGMKHEVKSEMIEIPRLPHDEQNPAGRAIVQRAVAPYEVDGWRADISDAYNHHRVRRQLPDSAVIEISFHRHTGGSVEDEAMGESSEVRRPAARSGKKPPRR